VFGSWKNHKSFFLFSINNKENKYDDVIPLAFIMHGLDLGPVSFIYTRDFKLKRRNKGRDKNS
jgi:hypothetical protein